MKKNRPKNERNLSHPRVVEHEKKEWIDWIDKNGKTIGQVNKRFAHDYGIPHAVSHVMVLDAKNNLIAQKRGRWMFLQAGKWDDAVGGHLSAREKPENAAKREAMEEVHAKGKLHYLGRMWFHDQTKKYDNWELTYYFWMKSQTHLRCQKGEVEKMVRIPFEKIEAFIHTHECSPWLKTSWKRFGKRIMKEVLRNSRA